MLLLLLPLSLPDSTTAPAFNPVVQGESSESLERPAEREGTAPAPSPRPPRASGVEASPEASPSGQPAAGGQAAGAGGNARRVRTAAGQVAAASLLNLRPVLIAEAVFRTAQILTSVFVLAFTTRGSGCDAAALLRVWLMGHIVRCVLQLRVIVVRRDLPLVFLARSQDTFKRKTRPPDPCTHELGKATDKPLPTKHSKVCVRASRGHAGGRRRPCVRRP